ncbi:uncharacterized protein BDW47DRAFT_113181 [Aspergillus candidus]|uniref:Uncharacterized protein n=1 Tax=Aspergillus candidus TaxID=41067 RepID=A0A2I2EZW8_ASPCN|nr:hypothetical protein BDW47DRAFT_113181 [Aspergillus candidus]PLB33910.1 hypothetical protein BDW47DRAFT_113181 [Aspergillus candidus]
MGVVRRHAYLAMHAQTATKPWYVRDPTPFNPWYLVSLSAGIRFDGLEFLGLRPACVEMRVTTMAFM